MSKIHVQRMLTIFVATMVVLHATFGCCAHHAHECDGKDRNRETQAQHACGCTGHLTNDAEADESDESHSRQSLPLGHPCQDGDCNFARTETVSNTGSLDDHKLVAGNSQLPYCMVHPFHATTVTRLAPPDPTVVSSALRTHLVLGVLLI